MGRRKIEMKMVTDRSCRQVTFSKRRTGLFKKANELATLCAVQIAIIVFSPGGKPFSFGNPGVEPVVGRFLNRGDEHHDGQSEPSGSATGRSERLVEELNGIQRRIQLEKKRGEALEKALARAKASAAAAGGGSDSLISRSVEEMGMEELVEMRRRLVDLREQLDGRAVEMEASSTLLLLSNKSESAGDSRGGSWGGGRRRRSVAKWRD
ncbi:unnamed protein product [Linum tenue]|uniref:MADS-box domain-containing protein n=1 Tax=Linum tenue TaxID=586396 RepID=A0AAV0N110_9ROSI|nr:unnamed protein product [Linum tenue]CAI0452111.1 unnamed protein product [Linum tenue]